MGWKYIGLFASFLFVTAFSGQAFAMESGHEIAIGSKAESAMPSHPVTCQMPKKSKEGETRSDDKMHHEDDDSHKAKTLTQVIDEMRRLATVGGCPHHGGMRICLMSHQEDCKSVCRLTSEPHKNHPTHGGGIAPQLFKLASLTVKTTDFVAQDKALGIHTPCIGKTTRTDTPDTPPPIFS